MYRELIREQIARTVAEAVASRGMLDVGHVGGAIAKAYRFHMSAEEIAAQLAEAAVAAGVAIKLSRPLLDGGRTDYSQEQADAASICGPQSRA